ncbi:MAG TPA: hypothetical protein DCP06_01445 [Lachnospiraceae bacterium]|nr:hypothetical protein [Lachnospiraceae bacterium]
MKIRKDPAMEREQVKIKISSRHDYGMGELEPIEVISVGELYQDQEGYDCLSYEEVVNSDETGQVQVVNNLLRIGENQVELIKGDEAESHMVFIPNHKTVSYLPTPLGELEIGVHTSFAEKTVYNNGFTLELKYDLEMNQTFMSSCGLSIAVKGELQ